MLLLSRKVGQEFMIGEDITVIVTNIAGGRATIGIVAPPDVKILRSELKRVEPKTKVVPPSRDEVIIATEARTTD